jgi:chemotaxis protein methyltransferase CheR
MSAHDRLFEVIERRTGICLKPQFHRSTIDRFLSSRLTALRLPSAAAYVSYLAEQPLCGDEFSRLIPVVTNQNSFFFRDLRQLEAICTVLAKRLEGGRRPQFVWSAACACGEEPYSIAMLCAEKGLDVRILATDINAEGLDIAQKANYHEWSLRRMPNSYRQRYFACEGERNHVRQEIRDRVEFRPQNLLDEPLPRPSNGAPGWDVIVCRNVVIYFDRPTIQHLAQRLAGVIAKDGWLVFSATESLQGLDGPFQVARTDNLCGYLLDSHVVDAASAPEPVAGGDDLELGNDDLDGDQFQRPEGPTPSLQSSDEPDEIYRQIVAQLDRGEIAVARGLLQELLSVSPGHVLACVTLGNIHLGAHAFDRAMEAYEQAQQGEPLLPEVHYLKGVLFRKEGEHERALFALRTALFLEPRFWCASFLLAGVCRRLGKVEQYHRNLAHTLAILESPPPNSDLFRAHTANTEDLGLSSTAVATFCRSQLEGLRST